MAIRSRDVLDLRHSTTAARSMDQVRYLVQGDTSGWQKVNVELDLRRPAILPRQFRVWLKVGPQVASML